MSTGDESRPLSDDGWEPDEDDEDWDEDGGTFRSPPRSLRQSFSRPGSCRVIRGLTRRI